MDYLLQINAIVGFFNGLGSMDLNVILQNAQMLVQRDVLRHSIGNHACCTARSVARNVYVFPLVIMETSRDVPSTITRRQSESAPTAPDRIPWSCLFLYLGLCISIKIVAQCGNQFMDCLH